MSDTKSTDSKTAHWQHHIEAFKSSGLSRARYCREHEVSYHVFKYWLTKLGEIAPSKKLVPVVVQNQPRNLNSQGLAIHLPNGVHVSGIDTYSVDLVSRLIAQL